MRVSIYHKFQTWKINTRLTWWQFKNLTMFSWMQDKDGDIAFVVFRKFVFIKYKQSTIFRFGIDGMIEAGKYQGHSKE